MSSVTVSDISHQFSMYFLCICYVVVSFAEPDGKARALSVSFVTAKAGTVEEVRVYGVRMRHQRFRFECDKIRYDLCYFAKSKH